MSDIYTPSQLSIKDVLVPFESREQMLTFALSWFIRGFRDALPRTDHEWMDYGRLWAPLFHSFRIVVFLYCSLTAMEKMGIHGMQMGACFQQNQTPLEGARRRLKTAMGKAFRELLEHQFMCSVNSFQGPGHTYFGNVAGVQSRIDHVCLPQSLLPHVCS